MKMRLIMNPGSRAGKGKNLWPFWESRLRENGISFDSVTTRGTGDAMELAKIAQDYNVIVAVGGDGTINEVLDGVLQSERNDLKMGVLYSGTSPDFCKFHGIPVTPGKAVEALIKGLSSKVDAVRITYTNKDVKVISHFGCGSNIGLGASIARTSNSLRKYTGDTFGTGIALFRSITTMKPVDLDLEIDGKHLQLAGVNNLSILKNPNIASGIKLNLDLRPRDGQLAVFAVCGKSRLSILNVLPGFYNGTAVDRKDVFSCRCSKVTVSCREKTEIEFDGDPRGFLPARIEILPEALNLIGAAG